MRSGKRYGQVDDAGRALLVRVLGRLGDEPALLAALDDSAPRVRRSAASALARLASTGARAALTARMDAPDVTLDERRVLVEALARAAGVEARDRLLALDPAGDARWRGDAIARYSSSSATRSERVVEHRRRAPTTSTGDRASALQTGPGRPARRRLLALSPAWRRGDRHRARELVAAAICLPPVDLGWRAHPARRRRSFLDREDHRIACGSHAARSMDTRSDSLAARLCPRPSPCGGLAHRTRGRDVCTRARQ